MFRCLNRALVISLLASLAAIISITPAQAATPRLMMVYGSPLSQPIILDDWWENGAFMGAIADVSDAQRDELAERPYLEVALFWGLEWVQYMNDSKPLSALRPEQANQHARFYPALENASPVFKFDFIPGPGALVRQVYPEGVAILMRHGIPVKGCNAVFRRCPASGLAVDYGF